MKKLAVLFVVIMACATTLFGQGAGPISIGVGFEGGVPTGDLSNVSSMGLGGLAFGSYDIDQNLAVSVKVGYLHFSGKDVNGVTAPAVKVMPFLVGAKYYLVPATESSSMRPYGAADVGLYHSSSDVPEVTIGGFTVGGGTVSSTDFGVSPILGARFKAGDNMDVDVHANYTTIFSSGSSTSWVGFGLGLVFSLAK